MDDVLIQLRISKEMMEKVMERLERLEVAHEKEKIMLTREAKRASSEKQIEKLKERWEAFSERGKRLTRLNVIRAAISDGLAKAPDIEASLAKIAKEGSPLGRPTREEG